MQQWVAAVVQYGGMPLHEHCSAHYGGDKIPTVKQTGKLQIVGKKWQNPKIFVRYIGVFEIGKRTKVRYYRTDLLHIQLVSSKMSAIVDLSAIFGVR